MVEVPTERAKSDTTGTVVSRVKRDRGNERNLRKL